MKIGKILLRVFAAIGVIMTVTIMIGGFSTWYWLTRPAPVLKAPENMVLEIDFTHPVVEQSRGMALSLTSLLQEEEELPLLDIVRALDRAKDDPRVKGIVARIGTEQPSLAHTQEIRAALQRFREKGKFSYIFAPSYGNFGLGNRAYYLASAFENIWLQPVGTVGLTGVGIEAPFGKTALEKIGVGADFMRRNEYKSVMENVTRNDFSPPVRANMESMMNNLAGQIASGMAESRKVDAAKARAWMANGPYTAPEALSKGLVTRIGYADEMLKVADTLATEPETETKARLAPERMSASSYLAVSHKDVKPKASVALINGLGLITNASIGPKGLGEDHVIDTDELVQAFAEASADPEVKAILFRVNSPGGAPDASESIRHALVKAKEAKKPVFVSMGDVAASGGYWIVMNADHIVAEPGTITGSIGVVAGKFIAGDLMKKLGVQWDDLATSDNAHMWSMLRPFSAEGRERVNALLDDTYKTFTGNVAEARKIPLGKMPDIAGGRVWTGEQAVKVGLVDELGGLATTVAAIKKHLKLEPTDPIELRQFPPPETPATLAIKILKNFGIESAMIRGLSVLVQKAHVALGPLWYELADPSLVSARIPGDYLWILR
ncbi:MAG: signal peptide peptidase SppA [Alphaproteobacteria bacterium]|nr:signal peptide peptidase SppA [Alphaproteobacteria bacterium]